MRYSSWCAEENVDQIVNVGAIRVVVSLLSYFSIQEGEPLLSR